MSQCRAGKRRASLIFPLLAVLIAPAGCSISELEKFATENDKAIESQASSGSSVAWRKGSILVPDRVIKGGKQGFRSAGGKVASFIVGAHDEIEFIQPVAVGGTDNYLYIVDSVARTVFKYDLLTEEITAIGNVGAQFQGEPGNIHVSPDRSFYVTDPVGKQVFHFREDGLLLMTFKDSQNLSRPLDVYVDELTHDVFVADGSYSHIVVFDQFGKALRAIGSRGTGPGRFRAITFMARGSEGLYVTDRLELPVQVITLEGQFRYSFGETHQVYPTAVAVSEDGLVFVSDKSDNTIRVYENGELRAKAGGAGSAPGRFRLITSLWAKGQYLYVADSLNKRVQVMRIVPASENKQSLPAAK